MRRLRLGPLDVRRGVALAVAGLALVALTSCLPQQLSAPPPLAKVACASGGTITVHKTLAHNLGHLLEAAKRDGLRLCGIGYRSSERQLALRRINCGTSAYDVSRKPARDCIPPTAKPGTSMHEKGLAIDFSSCPKTSVCYKWLARNAHGYGLHNLVSEPWHWSVNGG